jgi:hypothetical protein
MSDKKKSYQNSKSYSNDRQDCHRNDYYDTRDSHLNGGYFGGFGISNTRNGFNSNDGNSFNHHHGHEYDQRYGMQHHGAGYGLF